MNPEASPASVPVSEGAESGTSGPLDPTVFYRPGDVVRYKSERENRWCREEIAIAEERDDGLEFFDTFWNCGDRHCLTVAERYTTTLMFNLADYDELQRSQRDLWERYAPDDRQTVTSQHGLVKRYFIRKGATEHLPTQIENARERLRDAEAKADSATRAVEWARRDLAELEATREKVPDA